MDVDTIHQMGGSYQMGEKEQIASETSDIWSFWGKKDVWNPGTSKHLLMVIL